LVPRENRGKVELHGEHKELYRAFELIPANPNSKALRQATIWSFAAPGDLRTAVEAAMKAVVVDESIAAERKIELLETTIQDVATRHSELAQQFLTAGHHVCLVTGARGSGKTTYCNYAITLVQESLHRNHVVWFRADITKLHTVNRALVGAGSGSDADNRKLARKVRWYMAVHAFWVIHRKHSNDAALQRFSEDVRVAAKAELDNTAAQADSSPTVFEKYLLGRSRHAPARIEQWRWMLRFAHRAAARTGHTDPDDDVIAFLRNVAEECDDAIALSLFEEVLAFLKQPFQTENAAAPLAAVTRVILLIDGVDNIRCDALTPVSMRLGGKGFRYWYREYLKEVIDLLWRPGEKILPDQWIVTVRDETLKDIKAARYAGAGGSEQANDYLSISHRPPTILDVRAKKISRSQLARIASGEFWNAASHGESFVDRDSPMSWRSTLDRFLKTSELLFEQLDPQSPVWGGAKSTGPAPGRAANDAVRAAERIAQVFFAGNLRSVSRNAVYSFAYADGFVKSHFEGVPSTKDMQLQFLTQRQDLLFEGSVLSGADYMSANADRVARGCWCPNFFEHSLNEVGWSGLLLYRVLQAGAFPKGQSFTVEHVLKHVGVLGYREENINDMIAIAVDFGLFEIVYSAFDVNDDGDVLPARVFLKRTDKARILYRYVFRNMNLLYLLATGSSFAGIESVGAQPLGSKVSPRPLYVHAPSHYSRVELADRHYWGAATASIALLMRHINARHQHEAELVRQLPNIASYDARTLTRFLEDVPNRAVAEKLALSYLGTKPTRSEMDRIEELLKNFAGTTRSERRPTANGAANATVPGVVPTGGLNGNA